MGYSSVSGVYTPASGATTATAGATIASATWNAINNDYTTALTALGPANLPFINGGLNGFFYTKTITANFGATISDIATFAIASIMPPNVTTYIVNAIRIGNATGTLAGVTVTLYSGAGATGATVVGSTATTVATSVVGGVNSYQAINGQITAAYNNAQLFLHVSTTVATANSANVSLSIQPVY